jgi:Type II secretion system (T2SS), protein M subtype b
VSHNSSRLLRRCAFLGINVGSLALFYFAAVQPLISLFGAQAERLSQASLTLSKYRAVASREETVRAVAARANEVMSSATFLQGASEGAASASLQARLNTITDQAGARVQSVRALEPATEGSVRHLKAHLELTGPVAAVYATLQAIEGGEPYLFVGQALLRMPAAPDIAVRKEPSIEAQFDVYGPVGSHAFGR